ncbi:MAG: hypothetical protein AAF840_10675, partial [Bacteroidota bacterium]
MPNACADQSYVFDVLIGSTIETPVTGDFTNLSFKVRRCKLAGLGLSSVELVTVDGSTVIGALDASLFSVLEEDEVTVDITVMPPTETPTANRAGTICVNLGGNSALTGANLVDLDGDGNFDDFAGDTDVRFRFTLKPFCGEPDEDFLCTSVPNVAGGDDPGPDCRIREIFVSGRNGCGARTRASTLPLNDGTEFAASSNSTFTNTADFLFNGLPFNGYDFGVTGDATNDATDNPTASTRTFTFEYTLDAADLVQC